MNSKNLHILNDCRPQLNDAGDPLDIQTANEWSFLFYYVCKGYDLPFQLTKFLFKINEVSRPGELYQWSDFQMSAFLGGTTRNYVCNLRKRLKQWQAAEVETGENTFRRNPTFCTIQENDYNPKQKKQVPTGYLINPEFFVMLESIWKAARKSPFYKENWHKAIKEAASKNRKSLIEWGGFWSEKKQKRPRDPEKIAGTLWINFSRAAERIVLHYVNQGFEATWIEAKLKAALPNILENSIAMTTAPGIWNKDEHGNDTSKIEFKGKFNEFTAFNKKVHAYIESKGPREVTDWFYCGKCFAAHNHIDPLRDLHYRFRNESIGYFDWLKTKNGEAKDYAGNLSGSALIERPRGSGVKKHNDVAVLDDPPIVQSMQGASNNKFNRSARDRFLERSKKLE